MTPDADAQTPPVVDGNIDDLIAFANVIDQTNQGCGIAMTSQADDVCTDQSDVLVPCSALEEVDCGIHFENGYDLIQWALARDALSGVIYFGIRVDGVIGDVDGDGTDGTDNPGDCVQTPTITDPDGISLGEDYTWVIDTDCAEVGGGDIFVSVTGGAGTGTPIVRVRDAFGDDIPGIGLTSAQYVGSDLEVSVAGLILPPIFEASAFVGASGAVPDGLGEDGDGPIQCRNFANLEIEKSSESSVLCPGETTTFTVTMDNSGGIDLTVTVTDTLPAELSFSGNVSGTCGVTAQVEGQNITFTDFELPARQSCTIAFDATAKETCFGEVTNSATALGVFQFACLVSDLNPEGLAQIGPIQDDVVVGCGIEPCVTVECRPPTQTAGAGATVEVTGAATNCSDAPEDIELCITRLGDGAPQCTTFTDVPAGSTVTWTVELPCDEPTFLVEVDARAFNECRPNGVDSENGPAVCEIICEEGENCPRTPGYWTQQCKVLEGGEGGNVKLTEQQLIQIAQCVRANSSWFDGLWADDDQSTVNGMCLAINPTRPMNPFKQLQRHYAVLLANYCSGSLGIINDKGQEVSLDLNTSIDCDGVDADTIGELIEEINDALNSGDDEKYNDLLECADRINNGIGIPVSADCGEERDDENDDLRSGDISPTSFRMQEAAPNPFRDLTTIHYSIPEASSGQRIEINVYSVSGRLVRTLVNGAQSAGQFSLSWDGRNNAGTQVAKGVYFVQTRINGVRMGQAQRVLYLR